MLDPFVGSGTTAIAAKALNRVCVGFEINPTYWKIATDRVQGITARDSESGFVQTKLF